MQRFRIRQDKGLALIFDGELLAEVSSRAGSHQERWTEVRIYRTDKGNYVVEDVGRSVVPDEVDLRRAVVCETALAVVNSLKRPVRNATYDPAIQRQEYYFTDYAIAAFEQAAQKDPTFQDAASMRL